MPDAFEAADPDDEPRSDDIRAILVEIFPTDCDIAGEENLRDIVTRRGNFEDDGAGFRNVVFESVELLANATAVIAFLYGAYALWKQRKSEASKLSDLDDLDVFVLARVKSAARIAKEKRIAIYLEVIKRKGI